jgi:hypothetical protein
VFGRPPVGVSVFSLEEIMSSKSTSNFAIRTNPTQFNFSAKLAAIVGAIIGYDYGVRDGRGNRLTGLSITSDGFLIGHTEDTDSSSFLGDAADLKWNLDLFVTKLSPKDKTEFERLYSKNVKDWRNLNDVGR